MTHVPSPLLPPPHPSPQLLRIVVAEWQHIIYSEYLPTILGPSGVAILGDYHGYDPDINPSIDNAFATAAYRFGHSQILPVFQRLDEDYRPHPVGHLMLRDAFFAPFRLLEEGGVDPMVRGLIASAGKKISPVSGLNADLTEALFSQVTPHVQLYALSPTHCHFRPMKWPWIWQLLTSNEEEIMVCLPMSSGESSVVNTSHFLLLSHFLYSYVLYPSLPFNYYFCRVINTRSIGGYPKC